MGLAHSLKKYQSIDMHQATDNELKAIFHYLKWKFESNLEHHKYHDYIHHIKEFYPAGVVSAILHLNSEYNDYNYNVEIDYITCYDANGEEVLPLSRVDNEREETARQLPSPYDGEVEERLDNDTTYIIYLDNTKHLEIYLK